MQEKLLASLGSLSCKCWSLAAHVGHGSQSFQPFSSNSEHWVDRPKGPLLWFHALTLGETAVVLPVVFRCLLEYNEHVHVLLTTKSAEAISLLSSSLPSRVIVQDVPLDSYISMGRFLQHFQPQACILMESPAWPVLVESCAARSIKLGLLNARMSSRAFLVWFQPRVSRALLRRMLGSFSLIVPQSDIDVGRFRIFGATLTQMPGWCSDLKYAAALGNSVWHLWRPKPSRIASLRGALCGRPMWVAAHTQPGEEEAVAAAHTQLAKDWPSLLTVLAPAVSSRCSEVAEMLQTAHALKVLLWSSVVDMIAPQGHKQQQQQQQQQPQQVNHGISRLLGWAGRGGSSSNSSSSLNAVSQASQQQHGATGSRGAEAGSSSSSGPSAVDPALLLKGVDVLLLDLQADIPLMYSVSEVAFIGSSLLEGCSGHNLAEAAVAGCAVLVGEHAGHFNTMADELNQAAIVAAEEASAAVNSSGPMEDPFFAANADTAASAGSTAAAPGAGAAAAAAVAGSSSGAGAGPASVAELAAAEGQESEEPSPRDGSHWRGVLNYAQHEEDNQQHHQQQQHAFADGSGSSSRDGYSSSHQQQLQQQQHQQLHQLLQQQSTLRPSSAPAAVSSLGGASSSSRQPPDSSSSSRAGAPEGSSGGNGPGVSRNAAALLYRRHARTGSSNNSSCVGSPVASQRPSTAGGAAASQQQQGQEQQEQQQQQDGTGYLQQYYSQQQRLSEQQHQQPQQQRTRGPSPLQQPGSSEEQQVQPQQQDQLPGQQQQQQQSPGCDSCCPEPGHAVEQRRHAAVERPLPQAPPPSAATNTPVNGPTGNVTPVTPAGSFGGADPALLQQPDSRDLAHRLAQQQRHQAAGVGQQPRGSDCSTEHQQQQGVKQQQQHVHGGSSGGGSCSQQQQQLQLQHLGNSSGGGCASNCASTPLSEVPDLYSMPFPASPRGPLVLPHTPHPTPEDSAQTMGGRSPMLSCAGAAYLQDLASLALQAPAVLLQQAPSAEPSWQSAASSSGSTGGGCWPGQCSSSSTGHDAAGAASVTSTVASSSRDGLQESSCDAQQQQKHRQQHEYRQDHQQDHQREQQELVDECEHTVDPSVLQRPACPSPPDPACFSRASAASAVGSMPVFDSNGNSNGSSSGRSRSRLSRAISSGGWQEERQRQRHRQHLQGIVGGVWRGGSEGGSPMVAALAEAAAAAAGDDSSSSSSEDDERFDGREAAPHMLHSSGSPRAAVERDAAPWAPDSNGTPHTGVLAAADGVDLGTKAVSLNGGLSAESSGLYEDAVDRQECEKECDSDQECEVGPDGPMPFSRSPTFAELAACNRGSSADGNCNSSSSPGKAPQLNGSTVSAGVSGGAMPAREGAQATSNGCSRTGNQELFVPDLCPADRQLQQQGLNSRPLSDQGSVNWEDWHQQHEPSCNGNAGNHHEAAAAAAAAAMAAAPVAGRGAEDSSNSQHASSSVSVASGSSTAAAGVPNRSSDGGANAGASRLGDPRRSRHYLDLPSESSSVAGEDEIQPEQLQLQPHQLQALQQPHLLSYSGVGAMVPGGGSSSGGGGSVWFEQHSGVATPPSWGATPRSTPQQQHSAATTPSAGVTPRGRSHGHQGISGSSSNSHGYPPQHSYSHHAQHQHQHGHYTGRRSVDLQHPHPHLQQQHLADGSSGGGSGMFSPLSRLPGGHSNDSSYRRAESVTSMTSFATSMGGDRDLHDDQPGSSRMSLIGENSSHLGYSTNGGRLSGFTGGVTGAFASTGRFSECATPRSTVTEVFRGQQALQVAVVGGDGGGLLAPGTSYLRYRGDYILPATHLPAAPQGPAVWRVSGAGGLSMALNTLLQEPLERRSRGHAAAQAAAKLASGLVSTVWHVVDDMVVTPALQEFVAQGGLAGEAAAQHAARAPRIPGHPRI